MKKTFNVKVNGKNFSVEVEETSGASYSKKKLPPEISAKLAHASSKKEAAGSISVNAPLPGLIADVIVKEGQSVQTGEKLLVLEAMKMENSIIAPVSGIVEKVLVKAGDSVNGKQVMLQIKC